MRGRKEGRARHCGHAHQLPNKVSYCLRFRRTVNRVLAIWEEIRIMTLRWAFLLWFFASTAFGQSAPPGSSSNDQSPAAPQTKPNAEEQRKPPDSAHPSTPEVKPGPPVLKQKDLWEGTGVFRPLLRMPKYILQDQKAIWTSPFHTSKQDMKF